MNLPAGTVCSAAKYHRPKPAQIDVHHVWPRGDGGPNLAANRVPICGACHEATHELLREYARLDGTPGWAFRRRYPRGVQKLAALGWDRIQRRAM